jgi:hypothetical protein
VPLNRWFARGAQVDRSLTPYVVLAWVGTLTTGGRNSPELLDVYAHDQVGSLVRIDKILDAIKPVLESASQYAGVDGEGFRLVQADYLGKSQDGVDQGNGTAFRFSSWKILGGGEA